MLKAILWLDAAAEVAVDFDADFIVFVQESNKVDEVGRESHDAEDLLEEGMVDAVVGLRLIGEEDDARGIVLFAVSGDVLSKVSGVSGFFEELEATLVKVDDVVDFFAHGDGNSSGKDFVKHRAGGDGAVVV